MEDIEEFLAALEKLEAKEKEEETVSQAKSFKAGKAQSAAAGSSKSSKNHSKRAEYLPDPTGECIEPILEPLTALMKSTKVKSEKNDEINIVDIITGNQKMSENEIVELVKSGDSPPPKDDDNDDDGGCVKRE